MQVKLVDLFVDYNDLDAAVQWARFYHLEDLDIPEQVRLHRDRLIDTHPPRQALLLPTSAPLADDLHYKPNVVPSEMTYIEVDTEVDPFLDRLEVRLPTMHFPGSFNSNRMF